MNISSWRMSIKEFVENKFYNNYFLHQFVCNIFDESVQFDVSNISNSYSIIIYSNNDAKNIPVFGTFRTKEFKFEPYNKKYILDINGNFVKSVIQNNKTKKIPLIKQSDILEYFQKRSEQYGFVVNSLIIKNSKSHKFFKKGKKISTVSNHVSVECDVFNSDKFKDTVFSGIGSQKKFGFGLVKVYETT